MKAAYGIGYRALVTHLMPDRLLSPEGVSIFPSPVTAFSIPEDGMIVPISR
ncbi:MAG: hypothetical protein V7K88_21230 [Nostoc sp.]|uniref:hypothetical protein n=1 Tax=Nostoc sp. TaxID=1180 RepID=UPI002FFCA885